MRKVEMDLGRDLFTVTAVKNQPTEAAMIAAVAAAGFDAVVRQPGETTAPAGETAQHGGGAMPALVQPALDRAQQEGKLVLVDFYADWCAPCKRMLEETYTAPEVMAELDRFVFLKVDTDDHPEVSKHFGVAGIPDARVLAPNGDELARFIGFKSASEVQKVLHSARMARGIK